MKKVVVLCFLACSLIRSHAQIVEGKIDSLSTSNVPNISGKWVLTEEEIIKASRAHTSGKFVPKYYIIEQDRDSFLIIGILDRGKKKQSKITGKGHYEGDSFVLVTEITDKTNHVYRYREVLQLSDADKMLSGRLYLKEPLGHTFEMFVKYRKE